ncbi:MAG: Dam family site-specific DNA-(adenine-N6)-methyltransferase [Gammaproteobacteria bacterium]|nr:Dam family site-specific DNA-(adenine-N6)-methyltransferase [Gammaproteobacteria bacterium]
MQDRVLPQPVRPFLKWPGGKFRLVERIRSALRPGRRLIEPFLGSAAVFLNTDYDQYLLADSNGDLIDLYQRLVDDGEAIIEASRGLFQPQMNQARRFYALREEFNRTRHSRRRAALFLYLNRHCYNGLCRYNGRGEFNTPIGRYARPYFPEQEMRGFMAKARHARIVHAAFADTLAQARHDDVVYCDPPYTPLSRTAHFTDYHTGGFGWTDQEQLARLAQELAARGVQVVISNHDTVATRVLYSALGARLESFTVRRTISCDAKRRNPVGELLAVFG